MSTNAATASTPSTSAQPSAVARATPPSAQPQAKKSQLLDTDTIRGDIKKLRLVPKHEEKPAEEQLEDALKQNATEVEPEPEAFTETPDEEAEKATPWAKKVKAELEEAKAKVAEFDSVKKQWAKAAADARHEREEISDERDHYKALFDQAAAYLKQIGHEIDPVSLRNADLMREMRRLQRAQQRGQGSAKEEAHAKLVSDVKSKVDSVIAKFPELDPKKNKEAAEFLGMRLRSGTLETFEADCRAWVQMQRGKRQLQRTASPTPPKPTERPEPTTLGGTKSAGAAAAPKKPQLIDERTIKRSLGIK